MIVLDDIKCTALVAYEPPRSGILLFFDTLCECLNNAFAKRRRVYLSFFIVFLFSLLLGSCFSALPQGSARVLRIVKNTFFEQSGVTYPVAFLHLWHIYVAVFAVFFSGMTVFGRIAAPSVFFALSFAAGSFIGILEFLLRDYGMFRVLLLVLCMTAALFLIAFTFCESYIFSTRAFYGGRAIFAKRPFLFYVLQFIISVFLIHSLFFSIINL